MQNTNIAILGGGLAGLAASMQTGAPVYEADRNVGGVAASDTIDGFTFDRGIHILQTTNKKVLDMISDIGITMKEHSRNAYIYSHDSYTAYPFQVNTAGLPLRLRTNCVWSYLSRDKGMNPDNYEEWMYKNLGSGFADTFLIPYSEKFWTVHPREMTYDWTGNRVPQPTLWQVIRGAIWNKQTKIGTNVDFRYPENKAGYGAIADAMVKKTGPIHTEHRAVELNTTEQKITFSNGTELNYKSLITTIPLPELVRICPNAPESVREAASKLRTNSILTVNLGINKPNISNKNWIHAPEKDISFFRLSYPHTFGDNVTPQGCSSISAEVAYSADKPINTSTIVDQVIDDLIRIRALDKNDEIIHKSTGNIKYAYCIYDKQRKESLNTIHTWMASNNMIPAGRYALWTYFWSDEAILSGMRAAEKCQKLMTSDS